MLKVKARMLEDYIIFEITFPLTSRDNYKVDFTRASASS